MHRQLKPRKRTFIPTGRSKIMRCSVPRFTISIRVGLLFCIIFSIEAMSTNAKCEPNYECDDIYYTEIRCFDEGGNEDKAADEICLDGCFDNDYPYGDQDCCLKDGECCCDAHRKGDGRIRNNDYSDDGTPLPGSGGLTESEWKQRNSAATSAPDYQIVLPPMIISDSEYDGDISSSKRW